MTDQERAETKIELNEFEVMKASSLYKSSSLSEKIELILDMKHHSLASGCDATIELEKHLIPGLISELQSERERSKVLVEMGLFLKENLSNLECAAKFCFCPGCQLTLIALKKYRGEK